LSTGRRLIVVSALGMVTPAGRATAQVLVLAAALVITVAMDAGMAMTQHLVKSVAGERVLGVVMVRDSTTKTILTSVGSLATGPVRTLIGSGTERQLRLFLTAPGARGS